MRTLFGHGLTPNVLSFPSPSYLLRNTEVRTGLGPGVFLDSLLMRDNTDWIPGMGELVYYLQSIRIRVDLDLVPQTKGIHLYKNFLYKNFLFILFWFSPLLVTLQCYTCGIVSTHCYTTKNDLSSKGPSFITLCSKLSLLRLVRNLPEYKIRFL